MRNTVEAAVDAARSAMEALRSRTGLVIERMVEEQVEIGAAATVLGCLGKIEAACVEAEEQLKVWDR